MTDRYATTLADMRQLFLDGIEDGQFRAMSDDEVGHEAEWLLAAMDGLEIQFLLNPAFDLERSFGIYADRLLQRVGRADGATPADAAEPRDLPAVQDALVTEPA